MKGWWKSLSKGTDINVHTARQAVQSCFSLAFSLQNSARLVIFQDLIEQKIHFKCNSSDPTWAGCTIVVLQPTGYTCFAATGVKRTINFRCGSSDPIWIAVLAWDEWGLLQLTGLKETWTNSERSCLTGQYSDIFWYGIFLYFKLNQHIVLNRASFLMEMALNFTKSVSLGCRVFNFPIDIIEYKWVQLGYSRQLAAWKRLVPGYNANKSCISYAEVIFSLKHK